MEAELPSFLAATSPWLTPAAVATAALALLLAFFLLLGALWLVTRHLVLLLGWINRRLAPARLRLLAHWPPERAGWLRRQLSREQPAELLLLLSAGIVIWLALAAVVEIAEAVLEPAGIVTLDLQVFEWLQTLRDPALDRLLVMITELGGAWITAPVVTAVALWLAWRRLWTALGYWLGAALVARLSVVVLKLLLARSRPGNIYSGIESFSFPSGHATTAMVLYGFLAFLLASGWPVIGRLCLYAAGAVLIVLIGFSRLYLGVHWLTDVMAGFALGFAWVIALALLFRRLHPHQSPAPGPLAVVVCLTLLAAAGLRLGLQLETVLARYQTASLTASVDPGRERPASSASLPPPLRSMLSPAR